jgi:hypothetical protein
MAGAYSTFAIDNLGPYSVVAKTYCKRILVQENYNSTNPPTADLQQFDAQGQGPVAVVKGTPAIFNSVGDSRFYPGQVAGKINTTGGSITVEQIEGEEV